MLCNAGNPTKANDMNITIDYYNTNAEKFIDSTVNVDMSSLYDCFVPLLEPGAKILDVGCGSGRDSKFFLEKGYKVDAIDATEKFCQLASDYIGQPVKHINVLDLDVTDTYDAIWACASLLHIEPNNLEKAFLNLRNALKNGGILYTSFKYGNFAGERNGRYFTDMTEDSLANLLNRVGGFKFLNQFRTGDVREGRQSEMWLNVVIKKTND